VIPSPNGWHHHERVYIQGKSGGLTLIQYTNRHRIQPILTTGSNGGTKRLPAMAPWRWVPDDEVLADSELDELVLKLAEIA
jgi:hypothetical protein